MEKVEQINILKTVNSKLKYLSIDDYINFIIPLQITKKESIVSEIKEILSLNFTNMKLQFVEANIMGMIAKYGIIDITFEIESNIEFEKSNGIQILRESGWTGEKNLENEYKDEWYEFLKEMVDEIDENKNFLKIFAKVESVNWMDDKEYLKKQLIKGERISLKSEGYYQDFIIEDMCYTNYSGIWLWKHFYM